VNVGPGNTSKSGEEPFCHCIGRLGDEHVDQLGAAGGDVEAEKVFHSDQIGSFDTGSQAVVASHLFAGRGK
jgi:hypothetical protein